MKTENIELIAQKFLDAHKSNRLPIDVESLVSSIGFCIEYENFSNPNIALLVPNRRLIKVKASCDGLKKRLSIAQELGHYLLSHAEYGPNIRKKLYSRFENEADYFARALLMPQHLIQENLSQGDAAFLFKVEPAVLQERLHDLGYALVDINLG